MTDSFIEIPDFLPTMATSAIKKEYKVTTDLLSKTAESVKLTVHQATLIPGRYSATHNVRKQQLSLYSSAGSLYLKDGDQLYPIPPQWTNILLGLQNIEEREFQWIRHFSIVDGVPKITAQGFFPVTAIQQMQFDALEAPASELGLVVKEGDLFADLNQYSNQFTFYCVEPCDNIGQTHIVAHGAHPYEEKAAAYYMIIDHCHHSKDELFIQDVSQLTEAYAKLPVAFWRDAQVPEKFRAQHEAYRNFDYPQPENFSETFPITLRQSLEQLQSCSHSRIFKEILHFNSQKNWKRKKKKDLLVTTFDSAIFRGFIIPYKLVSYLATGPVPSIHDHLTAYGCIVAITENSLNLEPGNYFTRVSMALAFNGQMLVRVIFEKIILSTIDIEEEPEDRVSMGFNTEGVNRPGTELQPQLQFYAESLEEIISRFNMHMPSAKVLISSDKYDYFKGFTRNHVLPYSSHYWSKLKVSKKYIEDLKAFSTVYIEKLQGPNEN